MPIRRTLLLLLTPKYRGQCKFSVTIEIIRCYIGNFDIVKRFTPVSKTQIKYVMMLALIIFVAKPFVGFSLRYEHFFKTLHHHSQNILVKSFTKRKLEFSEDSEFSMAAISQKLANPVLPTLLLLTFALNVLLPRLFKSAKTKGYNILADVVYSLYPPQPLYLLGGKLTI